MKKAIYYFFLVFIIVVLASCSPSRFSYEPKDISDNDLKIISNNAYITNLNPNGATLDNNEFIAIDDSNNKLVEISYKLPNGFYFLNYNQHIVLATNKKGELLLYNTKTKAKHLFNIKFTIVSCSFKDGIVAMVMSDNSIAIYDTNKREFLLKEYFSKVKLVSIKIASPIFYKNAIFFPTLDGKIVVTSYNNVLEKINIAQSSLVKNIIFFKIKNQYLVVATRHKLLSIKLDKSNQVKELDIDIKDIKLGNNFIYTASLQGDVSKIDYSLNIIKKQNFKFANFYTLGIGKQYIWVVEKNDLIIKINKNFSSYKVLELSFDSNYKTMAILDRLYFDDNILELK